MLWKLVHHFFHLLIFFSAHLRLNDHEITIILVLEEYNILMKLPTFNAARSSSCHGSWWLTLKTLFEKLYHEKKKLTFQMSDNGVGTNSCMIQPVCVAVGCGLVASAGGSHGVMDNRFKSFFLQVRLKSDNTWLCWFFKIMLIMNFVMLE